MTVELKVQGGDLFQTNNAWKAVQSTSSEVSVLCTAFQQFHPFILLWVSRLQIEAINNKTDEGIALVWTANDPRATF
ncbi:hypothetical protein JRQ81_001356 [Phrynocephalus forsythii]|uniref:Uncharacterized protein n=1 Tax=Phrynocephalus forsythii TaxID=171643 RepID=A0A9Q1B8Z1_9SAUR|nr:hypothetical protein JRQ81_001356 [Phrynocephalus forsythii]